MTRRTLIDPMTAPLDQRAHRLGAQDPREVGRRQAKGERFHDAPVLQARAIGWRAPVAGANQTCITDTTYTLITGSDFRIPLSGPNNASWTLSIGYRVTITAMGAIGQTVLARILIDWHDEGIWDVVGDVDLSAEHGLVRSIATWDIREALSTTADFTLRPTLTASIRGGDTVKVGLGVYVGAGQSATVSLTSASRSPVCDGMAVPYLVP